MKILTALVLLTALFSNAYAKEKETEKVWYCNVLVANGLTFENENWKRIGFKSNRFTAKQTGNTFMIEKEEYTCKSSENFPFMLMCNDGGTDIFNINTKTGAAIRASTFGWLMSADKPEIADDLFVSAIKCEMF